LFSAIILSLYPVYTFEYITTKKQLSTSGTDHEIGRGEILYERYAQLAEHTRFLTLAPAQALPFKGFEMTSEY